MLFDRATAPPAGGQVPYAPPKKVRNTFVFRTFLFFEEHWGLEGRAPAGSIAVRQNFGGRNSVSRDGKCCVIGFVTPPAGGQVPYAPPK